MVAVPTPYIGKPSVMPPRELGVEGHVKVVVKNEWD